MEKYELVMIFLIDPVDTKSRVRHRHWEVDTVAGNTGKVCLVILLAKKNRYFLEARPRKRWQ